MNSCCYLLLRVLPDEPEDVEQSSYLFLTFAILLYYVEHNKMVNTCVRSFVEDTKTCNRLTYLASFGEA